MKVLLKNESPCCFPKATFFLQIARTQSTMHVTERQNVQRSLSLSFHSLFTWRWDIHHNTINHQRSLPQELFSRSSMAAVEEQGTSKVSVVIHKGITGQRDFAYSGTCRAATRPAGSAASRRRPHPWCSVRALLLEALLLKPACARLSCKDGITERKRAAVGGLLNLDSQEQPANRGSGSAVRLCDLAFRT